MCLVRDIALVTGLGSTLDEHLSAVQAGTPEGLLRTNEYSSDEEMYLGKVTSPLPSLLDDGSPFTTRFFAIAAAAALQLKPAVSEWIERYGTSRIGVVVGSSTSGIHAGESAYIERAKHGRFPDQYHYAQQEMGSLSKFLANYFGVTGPNYTISTACTSGAKALLSAKRLIDLGICDAVISGGVDALCALTVGGFSGLGLVSKKQSIPFSANRDGLNIGEGAGLLLLERSSEIAESARFFSELHRIPVILAAGGESSDAHHVSAPHPQGMGAKVAIERALSQADVTPSSISYINAHGTGTVLNDAAEAHALREFYDYGVPVSSTKPYTGHTLGAAGAIEAALCVLLLQQNEGNVALPAHSWDGTKDTSIPDIKLVHAGESAHFEAKPFVLSTSFAFGGSNTALLFKRIQQ
jgi:3-oxoacyl-[acyl-carrier-protein] synthase I